ncbi:hypothetical protein DL98DRAFT_161383 [Cadophora sp. DSE1049]|nr:hypothetical protein DL98DRAFT_161383 [Cadophora sp. DSE1049]
MTEVLRSKREEVDRSGVVYRRGGLFRSVWHLFWFVLFSLWVVCRMCLSVTGASSTDVFDVSILSAEDIDGSIFVLFFT